MRSCGGRDVDYTEYIDMYIRQKIFEEQQQQQGDTKKTCPSSLDSRDTIEKYLRSCNSHIYGMDDPLCKPSDYVSYLDCNS